jgi:hypothetical protein
MQSYRNGLARLLRSRRNEVAFYFFYIIKESNFKYNQSTDIICHLICRRETLFAEPTLHAKPAGGVKLYTLHFTPQATSCH